MLSKKDSEYYDKACAKVHSNLETPIIGGFVDSQCQHCTKADFDVDLMIDRPKCKAFGEMPKKYQHAWEPDCPHFEQKEEPKKRKKNR